MEYLYKYRGLGDDDGEKLKRTLDIIENHRLYFPTRDGLNDPLEGMKQPIYFGYMGARRYIDLGLVQPQVKDYLNKFRILSLCAEGDNMQMWAHYANNYNGVCIAFKKNQGIFRAARQISYTNERLKYVEFPDETCISEPNEKNLIKNNLLSKSKNWRYEKEWRIIKKTDEQFLYFDKDDIAEVIIGDLDSISEKDLYAIYVACKIHKIPLFYTRTNVDKYQLEKYHFVWTEYNAGHYNVNSWPSIIVDENGGVQEVRIYSDVNDLLDKPLL